MKKLKNKPTKRDQRLARHSLSAVRNLSEKYRKSNDKISLSISDENDTIEIPASAFGYLESILEQMAAGQSVEVISEQRHLTTQQAADYLQVSRPYLVKLLENGVIPFTKTGRHRRVKFADIEAYRLELERKRAENLKELAKQAQELNMGY